MARCIFISLAIAGVLGAEDKTTYDDDAFPIFQESCLNCHNPDKNKGGLDLSSFSGAMKGSSGGKIVEPGDTGSTLIGAVKQTAEKKMPPEGEKLGDDKIAVLAKWIEGGLLENKSSSARKPSKPKFQTELRSDPSAKPEGPPPLPEHVLLEPVLVTGRAAAIHAMVASPWAPLLAVTGIHQILLFNTDSLELAGILPFPEGEPVSLAFTPDGRSLIVGGGIAGKSGVTVTYDIKTGSRLLTAAKEFDTVLAADIRPGFDLVVTGGPSRLLKIWNTETGAMVKSIKKHTDWITALDLSNDGVLLATGDRNGGVWVWESESGNEFHTLRGHQAGISAAVFRADSNILATASEDGTVRYWEMNNGGEVKKNDAHPGGVTAFAFGKDGSSLTTGRDMKVKLWKPDFNIARDLAQNLPDLPTAVAISSDGAKAFVGDCQGKIHSYQTVDAKAVGEIQTNPPAIATRLKELATVISKQEITLVESEKTKAVRSDADRAALAGLLAARKRWTAASINTELLASRALLETATVALEQSNEQFSDSANALGKAAEVLNGARHDREATQAEPIGTSSPADSQARLGKADQKVAEALKNFQDAESVALAGKEKIDAASPSVFEIISKSKTLQISYYKSIE